MAKAMILSALVFGRQLRREQVACRGITDLAPRRARRGRRSPAATQARRDARVLRAGRRRRRRRERGAELAPGRDPLARIEGTANAVVCRASPLGEVTIAGPGAGPELAGLGVLSDVIAVARARAAAAARRVGA